MMPLSTAVPQKEAVCPPGPMLIAIREPRWCWPMALNRVSMLVLVRLSPRRSITSSDISQVQPLAGALAGLPTNPRKRTRPYCEWPSEPSGSRRESLGPVNSALRWPLPAGGTALAPANTAWAPSRQARTVQAVVQFARLLGLGSGMAGVMIQNIDRDRSARHLERNQGWAARRTKANAHLRGRNGWQRTMSPTG